MTFIYIAIAIVWVMIAVVIWLDWNYRMTFVCKSCKKRRSNEENKYGENVCCYCLDQKEEQPSKNERLVLKVFKWIGIVVVVAQIVGILWFIFR